ncbi:hypothetical protein ABPG72_017214 [Tetrahymena utriculariae]
MNYIQYQQQPYLNNILIQQYNKDVKQFQDYLIYLQIKLGKGNYGTVYLCQNYKNEKFYACKMVNIGNHEETLKEMYVASEVKGNYVCQLYFAGASQNYLYLMAEYCPQGTLKEYIKQNKPSLNRIMVIFSQIVQGYYESIYKENIIHRDLKLDNILMKDNIPKICDFGFGKFLDNVQLSIEHSSKCTPLYAAPQIMNGSNKYSYKADIYSLGVLLYQITNNLQNPNQVNSLMDLNNFHDNNNSYGIENTLKFQSPFLDQNIKLLIYKMMKYNEADRISIEELVKRTQQISNYYQKYPLNQQ